MKLLAMLLTTVPLVALEPVMFRGGAAHPGVYDSVPPPLTALQWKTDHGFSDRRIRLAHTIVGWLEQRCVR